MFKISVKWGVFLGLTTVLGTQILTWLGLGLTNWFIFLTYALVVLFVILSLKAIKKNHKGKFSIHEAITSVLVTILISRFIFQIYMFIYIYYIDPQWIEAVVDSWTATLQEAGASTEQIEMRMNSFRESYETIPMFTTSLLKFGIPQFVLGALVSLFFVFRKNKNVE